MGMDTPLGDPLFARVDASSGSGARVVNILPFPHREGAESLSGRLLASRPASADYINEAWNLSARPGGNLRRLAVDVVALSVGETVLASFDPDETPRRLRVIDPLSLETIAIVSLIERPPTAIQCQHHGSPSSFFHGSWRAILRRRTLFEPSLILVHATVHVGELGVRNARRDPAIFRRQRQHCLVQLDHRARRAFDEVQRRDIDKGMSGIC